MKKVIFSFLAAILLCLPCMAQTNKGKAAKATSLEVSFNYQRQAGPGSNQYAVWIENEKGEVVKNLFVTSFTTKGRTRGNEQPQRGYIKRPACVPTWVKAAKANDLSDQQLDAFTGATPQASGTQTFTWDFTDQQGKTVKKGTYKVFVEATLFNASTITYSGTFSTQDKAGNVTLTSQLTAPDEKHKEMVTDVKAILVNAADAQTVFEYQNPITNGIDTLGIRDCHVFRDGDSWYMTGTAYPFWRRQEEGGKPLNAGVPLYRSDDLLHWQFIDYIVHRPSADKWYYRNFWAPEIRHIKGKYYCTFNCANADAGYKGIFCGYAVSDNLTGPYRVVTEDKPLSQGNDLTLYEENDGTVWAFWNRGSDVGIIQSRIDLEKGKLLDKPKVVIPCGGKGEWDNIGIEGSCVFKRGNLYYLLYSGWTRGYEIGCATAPSITGPWTKCDENPIYGAQDPEICKKRHLIAEVVEGSPFTQVGHNQVFIGPTGDYWLSCHGNLASDPEHPMLVLDPLKFRDDGQLNRIIPSFTKQSYKNITITNNQ